MTGIDGQGRHDGIQRAVKVFLQKPLLLAAHLVRVNQMDSFLGQLRHDRVQETMVLFFGQFVDSFRDGRQSFIRRQTVGIDALVTVQDHPLEPRHADHEKLIQVRAEDGEKLHPLQQRNGFVLRFFENAAVKFQPGQFTIDISIRIHKNRLPSRRSQAHRKTFDATLPVSD